MTQRERHTAEGGAAQAPPPAGRAASPAPAACPASAWEEWYARASPERRHELLSLAARQGIVHAHQLGPAPNGDPGSTSRTLLPSLLAGRVRELEPLYPLEIDFRGSELDPAQRDAVARALATPDVCLIQGAPGTGKSRVVAEILARAAERGERALLLAPSAPALDRALELLGPRESVCAIRCTTSEELPESTPACVGRLTLAERVRAFEQQTLPAAREAVRAAEHCLARVRAELPLWDRFEDVARRFAPTVEREQALQRELAGVAEAVAAEVGTPGVGLGVGALQVRSADLVRARDEEQAQLDSQLAVARAEAEKVRGEKAGVAAERERVMPLLEARLHSRFFSVAYWKGRFRGVTQARFDELKRREEELTAEEQRLATQVAELEARRERAGRQFEAGLRRLQEEEVARRRAALEEQIAGVRRERAPLLEEWQSIRQGFGEGAPTPAEIRLEEIRAAREESGHRATEAERALALAWDWARGVEESLPGLAGRLAGLANVVAATTTGLAADAHFGDRAPCPVVFDLLVLEEAHEVTESEFLHAARRARRWVLVGEPTPVPDAAPQPARRPRQARPSSPAALRPGFFQRLWDALHDDPRRLGRPWFRRDGRLVCRLRPVAEADNRLVQTEFLADRPEIELRILHDSSRPPELAEVVFPGSWGLPEAKEFVFRELEEVRVESRGQTLRWVETAEGVSLSFSEVRPDATAVALEPGVREWVEPVTPPPDGGGDGRAPWHTCRIDFLRADGWTRERAGHWVEQHLQTRPLGRTARLTVAHRMEPALRAALAELLGPGAFAPAPEAERFPDGQAEGGFVRFVPVPGPSEAEGRRRRGAADPRRRGGSAAVAVRSSPVRGAGLETDLADPRRPDQFPSELRPLLPCQGLVNYLEAQALVRSVKDLLQDPAFLPSAKAWHRRSAATCLCGSACEPRDPSAVAARGGHSPTVAVMALYPSQVELLRRLLETVVARAPDGVRIEVGLPSDFRQRECLAAFVSLTRSHTHRAVPFGEGPHQLALALTRAASRLWVFGDPGTLMRRCQWSGPLDHLAEDAAERERELLDRLCGIGLSEEPHAASRPVEDSGV